ncbi:S41 family peptidase [Piscinibacter sp.]|uniref:S41 family peptidase n=1 Tax=Piscinibacter sp. TaxID=1903157 RepID=UPI0039E6286E
MPLPRFTTLAPLLALLLAACGGGGGSGGSGAAACDVATQKDWLRDYMRDWYYWAGQSPDPEPGGYATVAAYFEALKYTAYSGVPGRVDPWSYIQDSASYNRFFAEGKASDYGFAVNGREGMLPLKVRYVEPASPAAGRLLRGDVIKAIDGVPDSVLIAGDFALLTPSRTGQQITLDIERDGAAQRVTVTAAEYSLTPVSAAATLPGQVGYVLLKDFITQAEAPLAARLDAIKAGGARDLVIDLRYNGGGRISTANHFASQVVGALHAGKVFTTLRYNTRHTGADTRYTMAGASGPAFERIAVLTGARTCSASELLVNGLRPYARQVVTIGAASCGKPYGFSPRESCGNTYSAVNFRAVNALGEADYEAGMTPTCAVAEDFAGVLGDPAEKLTAAALDYLRTGACPAASADERERASALAERARRPFAEPGERRGMTAD